MSTYSPIASQILTSAVSSVTFTGVPQYYTDLVVVANVQGQSNGCNIEIWFNDDNSSTLYSTTTMYYSGSSALSTRNSSASRINFGTNGGQPFANANQFATTTYNIQNYANATTNKTILATTRSPDGGYTGAGELDQSVGLWRNVNPITSISIGVDNSKTMQIGSTFNLYGIVAGGAKANGGNTVTTDGTYWYHTFTGSGSFTPLQNLTVDYLVVGGGGAGGREDYGSGIGGGGGAGGLRCTVGATGGGGSLESPLALTANTLYPVLVGAGGAFSVAGSRGANGGNSTFGSIVAIGGGGGAGGEGGGWTYKGQNGGSGGGGEGGTTTNVFGGGNSGTGGSGTANQGFAGGNSIGGSGGGTGGGGGAGEAGNTNGGATGGDGVATSISGSSVTYAGGGGGALYGTASAGGAGGGGTGANYSVSAATDGTVNLGGGGGGGGNDSSGGRNRSGNGGSGIVIVRYAV
jgi:hypothetical protein